ncbi:outer membrane lipoprotein-sorting protein [Teredinibacter purpureus]|uniref:outer membrane lipoprotein-sorting protein n=1 Tax=Teredinibacter purpureus TaxID=2731756 RepID=UPI000697B8E7|nr:outer membrane lipoprotein-sorting protein [Teredinibacter purpureus]
MLKPNAKMSHKLYLLFLFIMASVQLFAGEDNSQYTETMKNQGLDLAIKRKKMSSGWHSGIGEYVMTLRNKNGGQSTRELSISEFEIDGDGNKSLTLFNVPADIRGTAFLNYSHVHSADEQWLFLPQLKRTKRIASKNKSGPFMGSEFSYEDLSSFEIDKYNHFYMGEKNSHFVVAAFPTYDHSGYSRIVNHLDIKNFQLMKAEYFDRKGTLLKTLTLSDYRHINDKYWRAFRMEMENNQTGKSTSMIVNQLKLQAGLSENMFRKDTMSRQR